MRWAVFLKGRTVLWLGWLGWFESGGTFWRSRVTICTRFWIFALFEEEANFGQQGALLFKPGVETTIISHLTKLLAQDLGVNISNGVHHFPLLTFSCVAILLIAAFNPIKHLLHSRWFQSNALCNNQF